LGALFYGVCYGMSLRELARILEARALENEIYQNREVKTTLSADQFEAWEKFCQIHKERSEHALKQLIIEALERARLYGEYER